MLRFAHAEGVTLQSPWLFRAAQLFRAIISFTILVMNLSPSLLKDLDQAELTTPQLRALLEATLAISANLSLAETLKRIIIAAAQLANARYAALGVPDESGEFLVEFVTTGLSPEAEARIGHRPRGHG